MSLNSFYTQNHSPTSAPWDVASHPPVYGTNYLPAITRPLDPTPAYQASSPLPTTPSSASSDAESSEPKPKKRKEKDDREKKRLKKPGMGMGPSAGAPGPGGGAGIPGGVGSGIGAGGGGGVGSGGEGMHVCVTCGRTDSPEWRKGPLGPKTLCNVSDVAFIPLNSLSWGFARVDLCRFEPFPIAFRSAQRGVNGDLFCRAPECLTREIPLHRGFKRCIRPLTDFRPADCAGQNAIPQRRAGRIANSQRARSDCDS